MIRIAIVDDEPNERGNITKYVENGIAMLRLRCDVQVFTCAKDFLQANQTSPFHVVFLDIFMPEMDGFALSKLLREKRQEILIVYITTNEHLVFDSFDYQPFQFLRKREPDALQAEIIQTLQKIQRYLTQSKVLTLMLPYDKHMTVPLQDVESIASELHYLLYTLKDGTELKCRGNLAEIESEMENYDFIRVHRSYLVNLQNVTQFITQKRIVKLRSGRILSVGRKYEHDALKQYKSYLRTLV